MDKILCNYHCHSVLSDGKHDLSEYVAHAIQEGFQSIGFSEHSPVSFSSSWNMKAENFDNYLSRIEKFKIENNSRLQIYAGLEVDYFGPFNEEIYRLSQTDRLDYFIGSVHYLGFLEENHPWCIDSSIEEFQQGFDKIFQSDGRKLYRLYYEAIAQMVEKCRPTIVGHIDKIKMYNYIRPFFDENEAMYRSIVLEVLDLIKKMDVMVELNMRGYYKHPEKLIYPDKWILEKIREKGIRLIVSSDCHRTDELSGGFDYALQLLKDLNFRSIWYLNNNSWVEMPVK
jgi:histidinol-phosphatase (PHP family)